MLSLTTMTKPKRIFLFFLIFTLVAGILTTSISSAALTAGKTGTSKVTTLGKGKDGKSYQNPHHSWGGQFKYTVKIGGTDYIGYCMQPDKDFSSGKTYTVKNYKSSSAYKALSSSRQRVLSLVMLYGYNKGKSAPYGSTNDYYAATQTMVWQAVSGKLTISSSGKVSNSTSGDYNLIKGHSYAVKCYNKIKNQMSDHVKGASFTSASKSDTKTYTMKYSYSTKKWSVILTDTNKGNYLTKLAETTSGLSVSRSGYKYTFSASKAGTFTAALDNKINTGTSQAMMVLQPSSSSAQSVVMGATDETKFYVKLKTEAAGTAKIIKTSDSGIVKGFQFKLTCSTNGYSNTFITDAAGLITANLQPGTYKVQEILTGAQKADGYTTAKDTNITVKAGQTASIKVHNKYEPTKGGLKVFKTTTDGGTVEGYKFKVSGVQKDNKVLTADAVLSAANPTVSGLEDYEIGEWKVRADDIEKVNQAAQTGKTGTYSIALTNHAKLKKTEPPVTDPAATTDPIEPTDPPKAEIINLDIAVNVILSHVKENAAGKINKTGDHTIYSDFGWSGSATLFDQTITTNITGTAKIDEMEFGTYTVTELMTELQTARYHKPQSQIVTIDEKNGDATVSVFYENKARTGNLKIKKACVNGKITDVEFTITGKTAWGEEIEPIVAMTDSEGFINIEGLAAGTYTVTESNLDPEVYVKQDSKTIEITGDETEPVEVAFENIPYTDIEISKQSETTGEELPGASLQVLDKKTGKVVEEWTSTEETHTVKGLEWGQEYVLHEDLAPIGYACAQDITFTAGQSEKITMVDEISKLYITKIDKETKKYLPGASFEIKEKDTGKVVANFTTPEPENGQKGMVVYTEVNGLIEGNQYIVHETKAPEGYKIGEDQIITFENKMEIAIANIKEDKTVVIKGDDKINKAVQTGDDWNMLPYVIALGTAIMLGGWAWLRRKDKGVL